jgi:hypothetical protein
MRFPAPMPHGDQHLAVERPHQVLDSPLVQDRPMGQHFLTAYVAGV